VSAVQDSKIRACLKVQGHALPFRTTISLSKASRNFVGEMPMGIQASQDVKLYNMARSLEEDISLVKTEYRLSRSQSRN
jgi:hypothetical protein